MGFYRWRGEARWKTKREIRGEIGSVFIIKGSGPWVVLVDQGRDGVDVWAMEK